MLIRVSNPPHRDLPIEWRTETGEFISQPAPDQPPFGQPPVGQAPAGPPPSEPAAWGQPTPPPAWSQPSSATPTHLPAAPFGQPPAPVPAQPASADDVLGIQVAAPDEHRAALRLQLAVLVLVVAVLGTTWAMGGLAKLPGYLPDDGIRTVAVGEAVATGPWRFTVERAAVFDEYGDISAPLDGGTLLILALAVENLTDQTDALNEEVTLEAVRGVKRGLPQIVSMRDGSTMFYVQPALPERVAFVWTLHEGVPPPQEIGVLLHGATWRKSSFVHLNDAPGWWEPGPRARTTVTVEDRRAGS
jgi:hypothetical protein